jgi:LysM repeat protein
MPKDVFKRLGLILGVMFLYGCAGTKGVEVRGYMEDKTRVDQATEGGNAGYIMGTPKPEDRSQYKKTRRLYVVEFSKEAEETDDAKDGTTDSDARDLSDLPQGTYKDSYRDVADEQASDPGTYDESYTDEVDAGNGAPVVMGSTEVTVGPPENVIEVQGRREASSGGSFEEYTVQKDDTLQKISKKFYGSYSKWPRIYEANTSVIEDPNRIKPGIVIHIPKD